MMPLNKKKNAVLYQNKPWDKNNNNVWLASTINLYRNIEKFPFPPTMQKEKRTQIVSLISKVLLQSPYLDRPALIKSEDVEPLEKEYLIEHFLSSQSFQQAHSGEAFILDATGRFLATINVNNHLQFELIDCQGEIEAAWNHMVKIETEIAKHVNFSFLPKFGFLTTETAFCGTGFTLKVFIQPSALIHTGLFEDVLKKIKTDNIIITGLQGNPKEIIGDVYTVMNNYTLGLTEENVIAAVRLFTTRLMVEEYSTRSHLRSVDNPKVKDKVSRAFGLLIHSYQIEAIEALNAISLLKLGADLNWLSGITPQNLNRLFFDCRRAHLLSRFEDEISTEELPHKRAEYIHEMLKDAKLLI